MEVFEFRSFNVRDHFVRHRNFLGELTKKDQAVDDFRFALVRRGSQGQVAFRAKNFPKPFLRHRDFRIRLEEPSGPGDRLFVQDSTFFMVPGLADRNGVSFESLNVRGRFLRHRNFSLFLEPLDSPNLAPDATFFKQLPPVLIDDA